MSSTPESGYATFLANFQTLITRCQHLNYNPGNPNISLAKLQTAYDQAQQLLEAVLIKKNEEQGTINIRQAAFQNLSVLAGAIVNDFSSFDVTDKDIKDVRHYLQKIRGQRIKTTPQKDEANTTTDNTTPPAATPPATTTPQTIADTKKDEAKEVKKISASQRSYTNLTEHFAALVSRIYPDPASGLPTIYTPTKTQYQKTELDALHQTFTDCNKYCAEATTKVKNARIARDEKFYGKNADSLYSLATRVKKYIAGEYSGNPAVISTIQSINLRKP